MLLLPLLLLLLLGAPAPAGAAEPAGRAEFEEASRLFRAGEHTLALPLFRQAYQLSARRPPTILALAQCERAVGLLQDATAHFREYAAVQPRPRDADRALQTARLLEAELAQGTGRGAASPGEEPAAVSGGVGEGPPAAAAPAAAPEVPPAQGVAASSGQAPAASGAQAGVAPSGEARAPAPQAGEAAAGDPAAPATPAEPARDPHLASWPGTPPPAEVQGSSTARVLLLVGGGLLVAAGAALAVRAMSQAETVEEGIRAGRPGDQVRADADAGFTAAVAADGLLAAGAVGLLVGLWLD